MSLSNYASHFAFITISLNNVLTMAFYIIGHSLQPRALYTQVPNISSVKHPCYTPNKPDIGSTTNLRWLSLNPNIFWIFSTQIDGYGLWSMYFAFVYSLPSWVNCSQTILLLPPQRRKIVMCSWKIWNSLSTSKSVWSQDSTEQPSKISDTEMGQTLYWDAVFIIGWHSRLGVAH